MSKYVPKELVKKAKEIDLLTYFMNYNPSELVKKGIGTYSLKTHDSVIISNGLWHRFSTNEGGKTALDYLMKVEKMSLQEAVKSILNMEIVKYIVPKEEKIVLNKYGRMRLKYLKEHKKADYTIMLINGTLNTHLKEIQETTQTRVDQIIDQLKEKSDLTENMKNTDMLYWVGTMNSIKAQAEEIVFNELIYV